MKLSKYNRKRPPQHAITDAAEWLHSSDLDMDRVVAERDRLGEAAVANLPKLSPSLSPEDRATAEAQREELASAAQDRHPVTAWYLAETNYSQAAAITVPEVLRTGEHPESAVTISAYVTAETPTRFAIRKLGAYQHRKLAKLIGDSDPGWAAYAVKHGLTRIVEGEDTIEPERDAPGGPISDSWIDWLDQYSREILAPLGQAIWRYSSKGGGDEGKL